MTGAQATLEYLDAALALCAEAGALLREGALRSHQAEHKSARADLVTRFDRASEALIVEGLKRRFPGHRILAEEGGEGAAGASDGVPRWLVDPLDGTTNFAHGLPLFSISVACEADGRTVAGVVHAPVLGWTFAAARGHGATLNGARIRVSEVAELGSALLVTGFPYDKASSEDNNLAEFTYIERQVHGVRRLGSAALDLSMVAAGWMDGYWERKLNPWDLAAGLLLVEEAGGRTSDYAGAAVVLARGEAVATNGLIHEALRDALRQGGRSRA